MARRLRPTLVFAAGFLPLFAWKWAYFGHPLPNSVVAKVGPRFDVLGRGFNYLIAMLLALVTPAVGLLGLRRDQVSLLVLAALVFPVAVGGDFMPMGRMLVPALPFCALLLARVTSKVAVPALAVGLLASFGVQIVVPALHFRAPTREPTTELHIFQQFAEQDASLTQLGRALGASTRSGETIVGDAIGAIGWYSRLNVYDRFGLVTPEVARRKVDQLWSPGHDKKVDISYFLNRRPTILHARFVPDRAVADRIRSDLRRQGLADTYRIDLVPWSDPDEFEGSMLLLMVHRQ
jgi:hypothetical protein